MFDFFKKKQENPLFLGQDKKSIMHFGTDTKGRPICMDSATLRNHVLVTGSTGSGKTEALVSLMTNAFAWGSGGVYVDGKGDVALYAKMAVIADHFGRRDDLYVLNFMTSTNTSTMHGGFTHRFNPFAKVASDAVTQMIVSLIDDVDGNTAMWKGRMTGMLTGVIRLLCWRRDNKGERLDAAVIRDNLNLHRLIDMAYDAAYADVPDHIRKSIRTYLGSIPGYVAENKYQQSPHTMDHHGYMEMQLTKLFSELCDVYGHIFTAGETDIDMEDIVRNRRFLLVMLPALEKSRDSIADLGKIVAAALKAMASSILSRPIQGTWEDVVSENSSAAFKQPPFLCIMDEAAYYLVDGFDLMAAQARSLNIAMIFASQDTYALQNSAGKTIMASTRTKIAMRNDYWSPELDGIFADTSPGRDDVMPYVNRYDHRKSRIMPSMGSLVSGFNEGEFVLTTSGKTVIGKSYYVDPRMSRRDINLSLTRLRSPSTAADELLRLGRLEDERKRGPVCATLPDRLVKLCEAGKEPMVEGATVMMGEALKAMSEDRPTASETDIVKLGE